MINLNNKLLFCVLGCMIGPALGGYFIGKAIQQYKLNDRVVVVKGLSEKDVRSDLAIWNLNYKKSDNTLVELDKQMAHDRVAIEEFLLKSGFTKDEIAFASTEVTDRDARDYSYSGDEKMPRYIMAGKIQLRTEKIDSVILAQEKIIELIQAGVIVSGTPNYYFTKLLDVRPTMIAEATKNARLSAKQFADDSGCKVGAIRSANQGVFSITAKDNTMGDSYSSDTTSVDKKVRVVSTITFSLDK